MDLIDKDLAHSILLDYCASGGLLLSIYSLILPFYRVENKFPIISKRQIRNITADAPTTSLNELH